MEAKGDKMHKTKAIVKGMYDSITVSTFAVLSENDVVHRGGWRERHEAARFADSLGNGAQIIEVRPYYYTTCGHLLTEREAFAAVAAYHAYKINE
jgi:hypothetical protein